MHMLVVLLCSAYRAFSCSLHLLGPHPYPPLFLYNLIIIYLVSFPLFFQFSVTGAGTRTGAGLFLQVGFVAVLQVGQALRCCSYLGLGSTVPAPHVPGNPTSIIM